MDYPLWHLAIGGGILMGLVAVTHVIVAHFAVGGGLVIAATETVAIRKNDREMRELARRGSLILLLIPTVFGVVTGVGIWFVAGLISPAAISALIHNYVWGWAMEWTFFVIEIAAALIYYATWGKVTQGVHVAIAWIYFVAAWISLVIINGIITFMLTPGDWLQTHKFWDGFFNPTYWPSLVLRTGIAILMATAFLVFPALWAKAEARPKIMRFIGLWLVVGLALAASGYFWWEVAMPHEAQVLFLATSPDQAAVLPALAATRSFMLWALAATAVVGVVILLLLPKAARLPTAVILALAAFAFFGGYERLREGARKPFLIHDTMFSNGLLVSDIAQVNQDGVLSKSPWAARAAERAGADLADPESWTEDQQIAVGHAVFQTECASCHTLSGYQGIRPLLGDDPTLVSAVLELMHFQAEDYMALDPGHRANLENLTYPFMPPFVGTDAEREALVQYLISIATPASAEGTGGDAQAAAALPGERPGGDQLAQTGGVR